MNDEPRQLLIVEDDESFSRTLRRSFERRGYQVVSAHSHDQMVELLKTHHPDYAVVDLKLGTASGLTCVQTLHAFDPDLVIVVLTGFASIATRGTTSPSPPAPTLSKPPSAARRAIPMRP